jgi:molecular chaperone GrpE
VFDDDPADGPETPEKGGNPNTTLEAAPSGEPPLELPVGADAALEFHRRARLAEDRLAEVLAAYRQVKTENEDFRERTSRNIERRFEQRRERLLLKFIDILDSLDRALEAAEQSYAGDPFIEGLILVRTQLLQTLQAEGLERVPAMGLPFDPAGAEAVGSLPVEEPEHHHMVVKELLRGYRLNGRIARASRVLVGEHRGDKVPAPAPTEELIGAEEVEASALSPVPVEPLEELAEDLVPEEPEALEPELELIPEPGESESIEDIVAAAERDVAEKMEWLNSATHVEVALGEPEPEPPPAAEPAADDEFLREAFGDLDLADDQKR